MNSPAVMDRAPATPLSGAPASRETPDARVAADPDCRVNALPPSALFERYESSRFLYPAKRARLAPYRALILDNWRRARRAGELLMAEISHEEPGGGWASVSGWRSTHGGWQSQHLVSSGTLAGGRAVMTTALAMRADRGTDLAQQNWFSPSNRFAALVFGTVADSLGPAAATVLPGDYLMVPLTLAHALGGPGSGPGPVTELDGGACPELAAFAARCRGEVFVRAESLDLGDLGLDEVDRLYRLVGLRRYRRIFVHHDRAGRIQAAALATRGPLGFNFSFLENRCDLLVDPALDPPAARAAVGALLAAVAPVYADFEPARIPVASETPMDRLLPAGAEPVRPYSRALWLGSSGQDFARHIDGLYERRRQGRGGAPAVAATTPRRSA
ncbi:hypothetical protein [Streptomyces sp. NPDC090025]|uniref:hypothetical protein n=1 Tax=Streptomyces sp. NPDC090025 TaxID=3365922 RepID=UPI0038396734